VIFNLPDFNPLSDTPTQKDFVLGRSQNPVALVLGETDNPVNLTGYTARLLYKKKMAKSWSIATPAPLIEPLTPNANTSRITVDFEQAGLDGSSPENFREYVLEMRDNTSAWHAAIKGRFSQEDTEQNDMSLLTVPLLTTQSALNASGAEDVLGNGDEVAIYINWNAGVTAGAVAVETAPTLDYVGAWSLLINVPFSGLAPKTDIVQLTGAYRAIRTRISTAVTGGTVSTVLSTGD
jgi:hypothetical protein